MAWNKTRKITVTVGAAAALAITGGGFAIAAATTTSSVPSANSVFVGCVAKSSGDLRVISQSAHCKSGEQRVHWNQTGQRGAVGLRGATGRTGATGTTGSTGAQGEQGPQGATGETGSAGPSGAPGQDGASGASGEPGSAGPSGPTGPAGPTGADGAAGIGVTAYARQYGTTAVDQDGEVVASTTIDVPSGAKYLLLNASGGVELPGGENYVAAACYFDIDGNAIGGTSGITTVSPAQIDESISDATRASVSAGNHTIDYMCFRQSGDATATIFYAQFTAVATQ